MTTWNDPDSGGMSGSTDDLAGATSRSIIAAVPHVPESTARRVHLPNMWGRTMSARHVTECSSSTSNRRETVAAWLRPVIRRAETIGEIPLAGSREWQALPEIDIRRFASVGRACLAWLREADDDVLADRITEDLALTDLMVRFRISGASHDVADALADRRRVGGRHG